MTLGSKTVVYTEYYKYPGVYINEHLDFGEHCKLLVELGTRALVAVIGKFTNDNMLYDTYTKLIESNRE